MSLVCPSCGASSENVAFNGFFCCACFAERSGVKMAPKVAYDVCKTCGRLRSAKAWVPLNTANLATRLLREVHGKYDNVRFIVPESGEGESQAVFLIRAGSEFAEVARPFIAEKVNTLCANCSRQTSGYFEAIVQVRSAEPSRAEKLAEKLKREIERKTFIPRYEETTNGWDIYAGSQKAVLEIIEKEGLTFLRTATLHGVKDGQRVYRVTYCVRA